jgi:hypothetical protein
MSGVKRFGPAAVATLAVAVALAACGGSDPQPAGSKQSPLQGRANVKGTGDHGTKPAPPEGEAGGGATPRLAEGLTEEQAKSAAPCTLVTRAEAKAIFGRATAAPFEAPQGPTCIYRTSKAGGFVTLALQSINYKKAAAAMRDRRRVKVAGHSAVCGTLGQSLLYVPIGEGRVLHVTGPCATATRFAAKALPRL